MRNVSECAQTLWCFVFCCETQMSVFRNKVYPYTPPSHMRDIHSPSNRMKSDQSVFPSSNNKYSYDTNNDIGVRSQTIRKMRLPVSKSDYEFENSYFRSNSNEPLIESSRTLPSHSFTFDNPAYLGSFDELMTQVSLGANTPSIPHMSRRKTGFRYVSRSLESIQDMVHDSGGSCAGSIAGLPGTVLSRSEETVNEVCTVRNIVLDEHSQAWDDETTMAIEELQDEDPSDTCQVMLPGFLYV